MEMMSLNACTRHLILAALAVLPALLGGCNAVGFLANTAGGEQTVAASYKGLAGQKVGVMVWADDGVVNDYHEIQLDTAKGIQVKLQAAADAKLEEVQNITWVPAEQILQYQQNHPETETDAAEEIAPHLGLTRLIYVEVESFQTHPDISSELSRGAMTGTLSVVEVNGPKGKVAYSERGVNVVAPRHCPPEGLPNLDDAVVYKATVDSFTSEVAKRFAQHDADDEDTLPPEVHDENPGLEQQ
jgi:hypothetical protein